jgi:hypothetical protein
MNTFLKICGLVLLFAVAVELSPLLILVLIVALWKAKGNSPKEKANSVIDRTKRFINS